MPFAPSEQIRAYLLRREQGNLLVYSARAVATDAAAVAALGGVSRIYPNHWHEAAFGAGELARTALGVPLVAHQVKAAPRAARPAPPQRRPAADVRPLRQSVRM